MKNGPDLWLTQTRREGERGGSAPPQVSRKQRCLLDSQKHQENLYFVSKLIQSCCFKAAPEPGGILSH